MPPPPVWVECVDGNITITNITALLDTIPEDERANEAVALQDVVETAGNHTESYNCTPPILAAGIIALVGASPEFAALVANAQALGGGGASSGGGPFWLIPLLLLLPLAAYLLYRRLGPKRRSLAELLPEPEPLEQPSIKLVPRPNTVPDAGPTPLSSCPKPLLKTRSSITPGAIPGGAEPPPPVAAKEVASKFRWTVDVGHYVWGGAGGAGKAMNVNWGKRGATSSTPIVRAPVPRHAPHTELSPLLLTPIAVAIRPSLPCVLFLAVREQRGDDSGGPSQRAGIAAEARPSPLRLHLGAVGGLVARTPRTLGGRQPCRPAARPRTVPPALVARGGGAAEPPLLGGGLLSCQPGQR